MSKDLFEKVKKIKLPLGKYVIFGSGPMCVRDLRKCRDMDIVVTKDFFEQLKKNKRFKLKKFEDGLKYLGIDDIEIYQDWPVGDFNIKELIDEAEIINGLPFVKLEAVLKWKRIKRRNKDLKDIELIKNYLTKQKN